MEWKTLNFFESVPLVNESTNKLKYITANITSYCCNSRFNVFCDDLGYIHVLGLRWEKPFAFRAHTTSVLKCDISNELNLLVIVAGETKKDEVLIKLFNITNLQSHTNSIKNICCNRLNISSRVSSLKISVDHQNLSIVVGCEEGDLYLHQGTVFSHLENDLSRKGTFSLNFRCFSLNKKPIHAVEVIRNNLLLCNDTDVLRYTINESGLDDRIILDTKHSKLECTATGRLSSDADPYFLIARNNAIYFFTSDGLGPCYGLGSCGVESTKSLALYKTYLVIVAIKCCNPLSQTLTTSLIVLDIQNKLVVHEKSYNGIVGVLCDGSQCLFFTSFNELFVLQEYSMKTKVKLLLKKGLFDIAIRLAQSSEIFEEEILANIYLKYGDHHLSKGYFDLAIDKYLMTLGIVDPYIIIKNLLDSRLNTYLYKYLEALLKSQHAKKHHIKLMMRCNERLNLSANLETYLSAGDLPEYCLTQLTDKKLEKAEKVIFDVSYPAFIKIIDNDNSVREFFASMDEEKIYEFFSEHGRMLFKNFSTRMIAIIQYVFLSDKSPFRSPERFVPLLLEHTDLCKHFLQDISDSGLCLKSHSVYNILFELLLQSGFFETDLQKLSTFLDNHVNKINKTHILLVCKVHTFLLGLENVNQGFPHKKLLSVLDLLWPTLKMSSENKTVNKNILLNNAPPGEELQQGLLQEINSSEKFLLEVMHSVLRHKEITTGQVHEIFNLANRWSHVDNVTLLINHVKHLNDALEHYFFNPIEFRSNICNICRQEIFLPASFHLCQHVFHKDCLHSSSLTETCTVCLSVSNQTFFGETAASPLSDLENFVLKNISNLIASCSMRMAYRNFFNCKFLSQNSITLIPSECSSPILASSFNQANAEINQKNPFENENVNHAQKKNPFEEYDSNLNPFDEN